MHPQTVSNVLLGDGLDDDGYLALTEEVIRNYHNAEDGSIQVAVHPHTTYSCSERLLLGCMELAERHDVGFATHPLESVEDRHLSDAGLAAWGGIVGYLQAKGLLQERTLFFHCDQVNRTEAEIFAEAGVAISHNPNPTPPTTARLPMSLPCLAGGRRHHRPRHGHAGRQASGHHHGRCARSCLWPCLHQAVTLWGQPKGLDLRAPELLRVTKRHLSFWWDSSRDLRLARRASKWAGHDSLSLKRS